MPAKDYVLNFIGLGELDPTHWGLCNADMSMYGYLEV